MTQAIGKVIPIDLSQEMKNSYLDYAMSVIVGRALPDVRDGLKPVHRRILYAMYQLNMTPERPHRKSAHIVGEVLSKFHPHGDAAVYDALVRMAQDFACRYPLVDGHGNFGSIDGDSAAAMRYTEARMTKIAMQMMVDIDKNTVDFIPNYDGSTEEPVVLPSRIPNLLINGSSGIAVGMATSIPPHNLGEIVDGLVTLIDNPDATIDELMKHIKGPDFPTGGRIMGRKGIKEAYHTGRGTIKVRAKTTIEKIGGKNAIIVHEIPYMVNKAKLVEKIAELVREKKIEGITDLRDESDRRGLRVVIELRKDVKPQVILNQLYKHTQLQDSFGVIMLALVNGEPKVLSLKEILAHYLEHQKVVVTRRTKFDLEKAEERAHILAGLIIALDNIDRVIEIIRASRSVDEARKALIENFSLSEKQAQAILDMRLQRLTGLEREKVIAEFEELQVKIASYREILADENKILQIIKEELIDIKHKFADQRKTIISEEEATEIDIEDLIGEEDVIITITNHGYVKRMPLYIYRSQRRGGRGLAAIGTREDDFVQHLFIASTHDHVLFFTNKGKVYRLKVYEIPEASRQARGQAIVNLLNLSDGENITAIIPVKEFSDEKYLFMATRNGVVKKTSLAHFSNTKRDGIIAITLDESDELIDVVMTAGNDEVCLGTKKGMAIRFKEKDVTPYSRTAHGVKGIALREGDEVVSLVTVQPDTDLLIVTEGGYGKRTPINEYRCQKRGGTGITLTKINQRTGKVVSVITVNPEDDIMMITGEGILIRIKAREVPLQSRYASGVRLMRLGDKDKIVASTRIPSEEE